MVTTLARVCEGLGLVVETRDGPGLTKHSVLSLCTSVWPGQMTVRIRSTGRLATLFLKQITLPYEGLRFSHWFVHTSLLWVLENSHATNRPEMSAIDHIRGNKHWAKHAFRFEDLASPITRIHFVSHPAFEGTEDYPIESPTNHWTLSLTLTHTRSVRVEIVPIDPGKPGVLLVESENGPVTGGSVRLVSGDVLSGTTVEDFLGVIIKRKRDHYTFAPVGEGCRYWLSVFSKDLVEENTVEIVIMHIAGSLSALHYWDGEDSHRVGRPLKSPRTMGYIPSID